MEAVRQFGGGLMPPDELEEGAHFIPVCEKCRRFVKRDTVVTFTYNGPPVDAPNASCKKCGRTKMIFEGYY